MNIFVAAFLIEHEPSGKKVMFDLGIRKDYWNLPVVLQKRLGQMIPGLRVERDVTEILEEKGIGLRDICKSMPFLWARGRPSSPFSAQHETF